MVITMKRMQRVDQVKATSQGLARHFLLFYLLFFGKILMLIDQKNKKFLGILQEKEKGCQPASVIRIAAGSPTMGNCWSPSAAN